MKNLIFALFIMCVATLNVFSQELQWCYGLEKEPIADVVVTKVKVTNWGKNYYNIAEVAKSYKPLEQYQNIPYASEAIWFDIDSCSLTMGVADSATCENVVFNCGENSIKVEIVKTYDFLRTLKSNEELIIEYVVIGTFPTGFLEKSRGKYMAYIRRVTKYTIE